MPGSLAVSIAILAGCSVVLAVLAYKVHKLDKQERRQRGEER